MQVNVNSVLASLVLLVDVKVDTFTFPRKKKLGTFCWQVTNISGVILLPAVISIVRGRETVTEF